MLDIALISIIDSIIISVIDNVIDFVIVIEKRGKKSPSVLEQRELWWNQRLKPLQQEEKSALKQNYGTGVLLLDDGISLRHGFAYRRGVRNSPQIENAAILSLYCLD
ncbi:hypothetical protein NG799_15780 [Laspinema sp. D1]|uniref:Uncharacterized protein n=1 Tax=Laspinema palackyanum D2a TaxID=2953684 RepID=A0ABT2MTD9_9CYAN|nr:hypothetical protein [Laspinema sp. D2a]